LWGLPAPPRASRLGLLRRDNVDKRKRKKRRIRLQVHPYRDSLTGIITPVSLYLQLLAPETFSLHSETTSAVSSTWYILAGIPVGLYLSVFTCRENAYIAMQKKRHG
jgi:hypothetical protein